MGSSSRLSQTAATLAAVLVAILVPGAAGGNNNNGRLVQRYSLRYSLCIEQLSEAASSDRPSSCLTLTSTSLHSSLSTDATGTTRTLVVRAQDVSLNDVVFTSSSSSSSSSSSPLTFGAVSVAGKTPDYYVPADLEPEFLRDVWVRLCQYFLFPDGVKQQEDEDFLHCTETVDTRDATSRRTVRHCVNRPPLSAAASGLYNLYSLTSEREVVWRDGERGLLAGLRVAETLRHASNLRPEFGERVVTRFELTGGEKVEEEEEELSLENIDLYRKVTQIFFLLSL